MSILFRALALFVAVCSLTWVGVLWWWQRAGHSPELADLVVYLGLLPLALIAVLLALRWLWQRKQVAAAAGGAAGAGATATEATATHGVDEAARQAVVQVVQFHVHGVVGDQAADLLEAAATGQPMPQPDAELTNDDGLPVLCARIADKGLDTEAVRQRIAALSSSVPQGGAEPAVSDCVLRALAALEPVLQAQQEGLMALHQARLNSLPDGDAAMDRLPLAQRPPLPSLRILMGWPEHWSAGDQNLARAWVEHVLRDESTDLSAGYALTLTSLAGSGEELWLRADQLAHAPGQPAWLLVLACDSDVDPVRVASLAHAQRLYDATTRPGGCMPGEGAAALLLVPAGWTPPEDMDLPTVLVHRPALVRRDKSVEAAGRVSHGPVAQALEQALMAAQLTAPDLCTVVCDADQHTPRSAELFGMAMEALPHLDPVEDMRLLARVTGRTGVASALLVVAAAAESVASHKKPTLALTLADPHLRMALVLKPQEAIDAASA